MAKAKPKKKKAASAATDGKRGARSSTPSAPPVGPSEPQTSSRSKDLPSDGLPVDGVLAPGAVAAVGRVARPVVLVAFVVAAALAVTAAFFRRDAEWTPLWLLAATWLLAIWAEAGSGADTRDAAS